MSGAQTWNTRQDRNGLAGPVQMYFVMALAESTKRLYACGMSFVPAFTSRVNSLPCLVKG